MITLRSSGLTTESFQFARTRAAASFMMKKTKRHSSPDLKKYMALPYRVVIHPAEDAIYEASVAELPGCQAHGETAGEAVGRER
jgi:hypothetical protein